jgi:hypothetical protein
MTKALSSERPGKRYLARAKAPRVPMAVAATDVAAASTKLNPKE